jgi:hypothetical protein
MLNFMKRIWPRLLCVLLIALCISLALSLYGKHSAFWTKCQNIAIGMDREQVENVLGPASREYHPGESKGQHIYIWDNGQEHMTVICGHSFLVEKTEFQIEVLALPLGRWYRHPLSVIEH